MARALLRAASRLFSTLPRSGAPCVGKSAGAAHKSACATLCYAMSGVYISFPFCAQKCTFCNFASGVFPRAVRSRYIDTLQAEIGRHAWNWIPETVYLGGGTPSLMESCEMRTILDSIPGRPWKEATIEAAPGTVTPDRATLWRECGMTRVSLGVQSFIPSEARLTGRKHTPEVVAGDMALLRAGGIHAFNIDLIAGLSGQSIASWHQSLDWVERLQPEHVSVYMLEIDRDSRLGSELLDEGARYGAAQAPSEDLTADLYQMAVERLESMGIRRYEISNFARPGFESLHNLKYWRREPYAGFGADAHSFDGRLRRRNAETAAEYLSRGAEPCIETTAAIAEEERFFVGLRLMEGIRPAPGDWQRFSSPIRRFLDEGLLETRDGMLRLTSRGVLLSNEVFQEFLTE